MVDNPSTEGKLHARTGEAGGGGLYRSAICYLYYPVTAMTADEVKQRVLREIGDRIANDYGWDFRPFLLAMPELRCYDGEAMWTVLVEGNHGDGYHVIFDAEEGKFGLATDGVCIGLYGGLVETLDAM